MVRFRILRKSLSASFAVQFNEIYGINQSLINKLNFIDAAYIHALLFMKYVMHVHISLVN